ncbi:hypothetical protein PAPYR_11254 [Paratrimastix pyriformis]|uniref:Uncharacterized protein n=1 Tax=Paratrimastix pyriformis TaxID=342808 RepID=A0ABQ8U953_9EUKA|nr:hypothetical protein PAPYR_11254 [Paratrimastix pyriformis]
MERVTECLVTKDEREVIAVVLFSWPIGPTTPDGSVPGTVPPGDNIARTRVMLTADLKGSHDPRAAQQLLSCPSPRS